MLSQNEKVKLRFELANSNLQSIEDTGGNTAESRGWLTQTFTHIELAPIVTVESGRPANPLTSVTTFLTERAKRVKTGTDEVRERVRPMAGRSAYGWPFGSFGTCDVKRFRTNSRTRLETAFAPMPAKPL